MPIRITGMNSGLDTEAIITQLASARSVKTNSLKKAQIKQQWTQDAWKDLNKKIYSFYTDTLSDMQYVGNYSKKKTAVSDTAKASVTTMGAAVNGTQYMSVQSLAKAGYMTGARLTLGSEAKAASGTKLSELGMELSEGTFSVSKGDGTTKDITLSRDSTVEDFVSQLKEAGLNASFDAGQQRLYLSSSATGEKGDFTLSAKDGGGLQILQELGLNVDSEATRAAYASMKSSAAENYADADAYARARLAERNGEKTAAYQAELDNYLSKNKISVGEGATTEEKAAAAAEFRSAWEAKNSAYKDWEANKAEYDKYKAALDAGEDTSGYTVTVDPGEGPEKPGADPGQVPALSLLEEDDEETGKLLEADRNFYNALTGADFSVKGGTGSEAFTGAAGGNKLDGSDAKITLNGVEYTSRSNNFSINGLSITALEESDYDEATGQYKEFTLTTANDNSGVKDMIKNFITKYNDLVNEMSKLYNAGANKDYEPLLSEEKSELSDKEVEEWEGKVKESLLRKDSTLSNVMNSMVEMMSRGYEITRTLPDGTTKKETAYLQSFGIDNLSYFKAEANERNAYHIDGDADDPNTSGEDDILGFMVDADPDAVADFFSQLTKGVYGKLTDLMKSTAYSSAYTVYEDKQMRSEYSEYNDKISAAETKLNEYLDKWYARFSAMETAMANLNSKQSSLAGLFGG